MQVVFSQWRRFLKLLVSHVYESKLFIRMAFFEKLLTSHAYVTELGFSPQMQFLQLLVTPTREGSTSGWRFFPLLIMPVRAELPRHFAGKVSL